MFFRGHTGVVALLPCINLDKEKSNASRVLFMLHRRQYPAVLAFTITIKNKSQGQRFDRVGIIIDRPLFSHVQSYVASSRC